MSSKFYRDSGGTTWRVLHTLERFHSKHGAWPEALAMDGESLVALVQYGLTPLGFYRLQSKLELRVENTSFRHFIALDSTGRECDYVENGVEVQDSGPSAAEWLGFDDLGA